ncbi:hypothetical protein C8Q79DRAFT_641410 [Trametes meyenii]|nr:hypothetical protein C8Q79DRAFT_641410 [Trametes meyenii]
MPVPPGRQCHVVLRRRAFWGRRNGRPKRCCQALPAWHAKAVRDNATRRIFLVSKYTALVVSGTVQPVSRRHVYETVHQPYARPSRDEPGRRASSNCWDASTSSCLAAFDFLAPSATMRRCRSRTAFHYLTRYPSSDSAKPRSTFFNSPSPLLAFSRAQPYASRRVGEARCSTINIQLSPKLRAVWVLDANAVLRLPTELLSLAP